MTTKLPPRRLRGAGNLMSSIKLMLNHTESTRIDLARGLVLQLRPGVSFTLARRGEVRPSKQEATIVCQAARKAGLNIYAVNAYPDDAGPWKCLRWDLQRQTVAQQLLGEEDTPPEPAPAPHPND